MPLYMCPRCGRVVKRERGTYYCKRCGTGAIMREVSVSDVVASLSPTEWECWEYICASGKVSADELERVNPAWLGAVGKLKAKGLVETERLPWKTYIWSTIDIFEE